MKMTHTEFLGLQSNVERLAGQLKTGDYIVLEPDLGGYCFVATFAETGCSRVKTRGFESLRNAAALSLRLEQPIVLSQGTAEWREQVGNRLHAAGVTVITEWAEED